MTDVRGIFGNSRKTLVYDSASVVPWIVRNCAGRNFHTRHTRSTTYTTFPWSRSSFSCYLVPVAIRIKFHPIRIPKNGNARKSRAIAVYLFLFRASAPVYETMHVYLRCKLGGIEPARETPGTSRFIFALRPAELEFSSAQFFYRDLDANVSNNARFSHLNGARRESKDTNASTRFRFALSRLLLRFVCKLFRTALHGALLNTVLAADCYRNVPGVS